MNKTQKIFTAPDYNEAVEKATEYFQCGKKELFINTLDEGNQLLDCMIMAVYVGKRIVDPDSLNADFNIFYEDDGVYLEIYPNMDNGMPVEPEIVMTYIQRKGISALEAESVITAIKAGKGRVKIGPAQDEVILGEGVAVTISADEMEAFIKFLPPDEGGAVITFNEISEKLRSAGVVHGISVISMGDAFKEKKYGKSYSVAAGTLPVHGEDGSLTYYFDKEKKTGKPVEGESGKVDFRNLDLFVPVKEGQLLITRKLATAGKSGYTIKNRELKAKPGRDVNLPKTKNVIINEGKTAVYSKLSGMVEVKDGGIIVSDVYTVKGDCDLSVGNIDFDGSVVIAGGVISGMVVKTSGNITVGGVVGDAELIAGGDIELKRGMQGVDKGKITAQGSITAAFLERGDITAGQDITADVIMHCNIQAGRYLIAKGKRGNIMGGRAMVAKEVCAKTIGAVSHVQTDIEVGLMPYKAERMKFLKAELEKLDQEEQKIRQIEQYLSKAVNLNEEKRADLAKSVESTRNRNTQLLADYSEEYSRLKYELEHAVDGKVHCTVTTYPGTRIVIGNGIYKVNEQISFATYKYRDSSVIFTACEISGSGQ